MFGRMRGEEPFKCSRELMLSPNTEVLQMVLYFLSDDQKVRNSIFLKQLGFFPLSNEEKSHLENLKRRKEH